VVALLPVWNAERFIAPVLDSWANQTYPNLQVLISDDASTDRTAEICADFAARHAKFELLRQPRRLGWVGNTNALLSRADGAYFMFAAHDDIPMATYVARLLGLLEDNQQAVLSFSDIWWRNGPDNSKSPNLYVYRDLDGVSNRLERSVRAARRIGIPPSYLITVAYRGLFRASAARQVGGLHRHMAGEYGADWPWLLHLALLGEFVRVPEALIEKVTWPTSLSGSWKGSVWQHVGVVAACLRVTVIAELSLAERIKIQRELLEGRLKGLLWRSLNCWRR
jgi:glycosyltransferase involved in cell wall biosynthesis